MDDANAPAADGAGEVSPDGLRIAFYSERDGDGDIYVMNRDGSDLKNLTNDEATQYELSWSPDSRRIAYYSDAPDPAAKRFDNGLRSNRMTRAGCSRSIGQ